MRRPPFRAWQASRGIGLVHYGGVACRSDRRDTGRNGAITGTHPSQILATNLQDTLCAACITAAIRFHLSD